MRKSYSDPNFSLRERALRFLAQREHSRRELERKLAPHAGNAAELQSLLDDLERKKQLSDRRFAEGRARVLSRKYGAARIRHDLKVRGISEEISGKVSSGLNDLEKARQILQRKYRDPATTREERAKRARFLQGRGFSYDAIRSALGALADD